MVLSLESSIGPLQVRASQQLRKAPLLLESLAFSFVTHKSRCSKLLWGDAADCFEKRCKLETCLRTHMHNIHT